MSKQRNVRTGIIFGLCALVLCMGVGFAYMSQQLNISGTANVADAKWDVNITSITAGTPVQGATNIETPKGDASITDLGKTANFEVNLYAPGDALTYTVTVTNSGTIPAKVDEVTENPKYSTTAAETVAPIKFSYDNTIIGKKLAANGGTATMTVTIEYDKNATALATAAQLNYQLTVLCSQDTEA